MNATVEDLRPTIVPKSDQLNAEQLLGGPMTIRVTEVRVGGGEEQPLSVHYENENGRPYKPCKTMRKVLIHAWGPNGREWSGKSMTLYNDPSVKWGGEDVGGIRISHMSDIPRDIKVSLTTTRGKKAKYEVRRLESALAGQMADITNSPNVAALKENFGAAWANTKDNALRAQLKAAYDARMAELVKPSDDEPLDHQATKTYAQFADDINNATAQEPAAFVLDEAREVLPADQVADLVKVFDKRWSK